jgi:ABC-type spermidine/putrescine transport system permease subunit II
VIMASRASTTAVRSTDLVLRIIIIVFMLSPALLIAVLSFSNEASLSFPPDEWGLDRYRELADSSYWISSIVKSFLIATPTAVLCLLIGVPAAFALNRTRMPLRGAVTALGLAPLVLPGVAYAVAMYTFFIQIGLIGSTLGLIAAHVILSLPFVIIIVGAAINRIPPELELVAMTLGASRLRAMTGITLRLLSPAIAATFIFCFIHSFDEATFVNFLGGPGLITLPKAIFDSVRTGLEPLITAIATILMIATGVVMMLATYWRSDRGR